MAASSDNRLYHDLVDRLPRVQELNHFCFIFNPYK